MILQGPVKAEIQKSRALPKHANIRYDYGLPVLGWQAAVPEGARATAVRHR
jgi:hypothetical protein